MVKGKNAAADALSTALAGLLDEHSPGISRLCSTRTMEVVGLDAAADKD